MLLDAEEPVDPLAAMPEVDAGRIRDRGGVPTFWTEPANPPRTWAWGLGALACLGRSPLLAQEHCCSGRRSSSARLRLRPLYAQLCESHIGCSMVLPREALEDRHRVVRICIRNRGQPIFSCLRADPHRASF